MDHQSRQRYVVECSGGQKSRGVEVLKVSVPSFNLKRGGLSFATLFLILQTLLGPSWNSCAAVYGQAASDLSLHAELALTPEDELLIEQIDALEQAGRIVDARDAIDRVVQKAAGRLVGAASVRKASTLLARPYLPAESWARNRVLRMRADHADLIDSGRTLGSIGADFEKISTNRDLAEIQRYLRRIPDGPDSVKLSLLWVDCLLERGQAIAAYQVLQQQFPTLSVSVPGVENPDALVCFPFSYFVQIAGQGTTRDQEMEDWVKRIDRSLNGVVTWDALLRRCLVASAMSPGSLGYDDVRQICQTLATALPGEAANRLKVAIEGFPAWRHQRPTQSNSPLDFQIIASSTDASIESPRFELDHRPDWEVQLEAVARPLGPSAMYQQPVGEEWSMPKSYVPVIAGGKLFVNNFVNVRGYLLRDGAEWPPLDSRMVRALGDDPAEWQVPAGYPSQGIPRALVSVGESTVVARVGSVVTGWRERKSMFDSSSRSSLVGFDLSAEGKLLPGYPKRIDGTGLENSEIEGLPIIRGEKVIVPVLQREGISLRRSLVCLNRTSGRIEWRAANVANGHLESDQVALVSAQRPIETGGRVFWVTDLGVVACIDRDSGELCWLTRYESSQRTKSSGIQAQRHQFRELKTCAVVNGMVLCMPADCPELFALSVETGELLWSTDSMEVSDINQLVGVVENYVVASGDRLVWIDIRTGEVVARFGGVPTTMLGYSLPQPRGLGYCRLVGSSIYWPTANEVLVFDARPEIVANGPEERMVPRLRNRYWLGQRGAGGAHIVHNDQWMILATSTRILAYSAKLGRESDH